jgi:choline dehydrogenase
VGYEQSTTFRGKRRSSADSFLRPVIGDERLTLVTEVRANRVLFDGQRAIGIEYVKDGKVHQAKATHEVVLTAGAFATLPQAGFVGRPVRDLVLLAWDVMAAGPGSA